jgi:ATP-dependent helicase HrpA
MRDNEALRQEVEKLEHKRRRHDVLADESAQYEFFDARIPPEVNSAKSFGKWFQGLTDEQRDALIMGFDVLMRDDAGVAPEDRFPDWLEMSGQRFGLEYRFDPGHEADGVSLTVPLELLNVLDQERLSWQVPGLRRDKVIALIKQLPRPLRRALTPAPQFADAALEAIGNSPEGSLHDALARELSRITGEPIDPGLLDESGIEDHLKIRVCVVDEAGQILEASRDLQALQRALGEPARRRFMDRQGGQHNRDGLREWTFGEIEESVTTENGITAWPALVDQGDAVGVRLFDTFEEAWLSHQEGVLRVMEIQLPDKLKYLQKHHGISRAGLLAWSAMGNPNNLIRDLVHSSLRRAAGDVAEVRSSEMFDALLERVRKELGTICTRRARLVSEILETASDLRTRLNDLDSQLPEACRDLDEQISDLIYEGFLEELEPGRLEHYPRYLAAIAHRLEKLEVDPRQDLAKLERVLPWWRRYQECIEGGMTYDRDLDVFRWLIEEYRVSVFAQHLGTKEKVSEKRLQEAWDRVEQTQ